MNYQTLVKSTLHITSPDDSSRTADNPVRYSSRGKRRVSIDIMYGHAADDPVVEYYDIAFGITGESEREYYLEKMDRYGGPVLDLAGGTGRFTLEAAMRGLEVTFVDSSPGMHSVLSSKLKSLGNEIAERVTTRMAEMHDFPGEKSFGLAMCVDAFFHNLTPGRREPHFGASASL